MRKNVIFFLRKCLTRRTGRVYNGVSQGDTPTPPPPPGGGGGGGGARTVPALLYYHKKKGCTSTALIVLPVIQELPCNKRLTLFALQWYRPSPFDIY